MKTGRFDHVLQVERRAVAVGQTGEIGRTWEVVGRRWANIEPMESMSPETITAAGEVQSIKRYRIRMVGRLEVRAEDRLVHQSDARIFSIQQVSGADGKSPLSAEYIEIDASIADQMEDDKEDA